MSTTRLATSLFLVAALIYATFFFGCSAKERTYSKQISSPLAASSEVAQWRELAAEVADRVEKALYDRPDLREKPICVVQPSPKDFSMAFYKLLRTELVSRGLQVSIFREKGGMDLSYTAQILNMGNTRANNQERTSFGRSYSVPSGRVLYVLLGSDLTFNNRHVMHSSAVYRVTGASLGLYGRNPAGLDKSAVESFISRQQAFRVF